MIKKWSWKLISFNLKNEKCSDEETTAVIVALPVVKKNKKKRKRSVWVKPWLRRRINLGL